MGVPLPPGLAGVFLEATDRPLFELLRRYARTHGPFTTTDAATRFGLAPSQIEPVLRRLHGDGKLLEGEFRPEGVHREWCDPDVLQQIRRKTLARLRREVVPAEQHTFVRLLTRWQGVAVPRRGLDALLDTIEILQGAILTASDLEREILPARVRDYSPNDLDGLMASGNVVWIGREQLGDRDGRIALYLADALPRLLAVTPPPELSERAQRIAGVLREIGRVVLCAAPSGKWRRLPGRYAGGSVGTGVGRCRDQRHAASLAQSSVRQGWGTAAARVARRSARFARVSTPLPRPHGRQPRRRRPLVAGGAANRGAANRRRMERQCRPAMLTRNGIVHA